MKNRLFIVGGLALLGILSFWLGDFFVSDPTPGRANETAHPIVAKTEATSLPSFQAIKKMEVKTKLEAMAPAMEPRSVPVRASTLERIRSGKLIQRVETEVDQYGIRSTLSVYETDMKYPMVQLQEDWKTDSEGKPKLVGWRGMAANQLLIRAGASSSPQLQKVLADHGAQIVETKIPGVFRVEFDGSDPMNLHDLTAELSDTPGVKSAEPNLIISIEH